MTLDPTLIAYAQRWLGNLMIDLTRYAVFAIAVWLVIWVLLRRPMASRKIRDTTPGARQLVTEFAVSLRSLAIFSTVGLVMFSLERAGWLPGPAAAMRLGWTWAAASLVLMTIGHDAYFYWTHRAMHDRRLLRTFHRRHHRSQNPSPFSAYSFDLAEAVVQAAFVPLWLLTVPTSWPVVGLFMVHQIARNTLGHCGYEVFPATADGRPLLGFMTSVTHHDLHHEQGRWNFGLYFSWWDRWMGTEHPEYLARFAAASGRHPQLTAAGRHVAALAGLATALGLAALTAHPSAAQASTETPQLAGRWTTPGDRSVVEFGSCAEPRVETRICGRIVALSDPSARERRDVRNPGAANRSRPVLGLQIVRDLRETAPGVWTGGDIYNPDDGRTYRGAVRLRAGDSLELKGCALAVVCQTQVWRRVGP